MQAAGNRFYVARAVSAGSPPTRRLLLCAKDEPLHKWDSGCVRPIRLCFAWAATRPSRKRPQERRGPHPLSPHVPRSGSAPRLSQPARRGASERNKRERSLNLLCSSSSAAGGTMGLSRQFDLRRRRFGRSDVHSSGRPPAPWTCRGAASTSAVVCADGDTGAVPRGSRYAELRTAEAKQRGAGPSIRRA